ncbi:Thymidylate kinase [Corynebacterium occultum]|uniref:Thymidylate kinase n=1 Tax=Corynebacterium occultum TaxID=2675219 RepID=A0A6B8WJJ9_9CORY|nr:dTMP kinase [Corynebacterium occultum]QGU06628.1 Thymidylate kinase [Corynebacterium occultum]
MIISIEGIDGAGKNTLVRAIQRETGAQALAFPRYEESIHAQLAAEALHGRMGDLTDSAYAMATLFALDRHGALPTLERFVDSDELLILDRYVASNAAYSFARTADEGVIGWVHDLEFNRLGLPKPDLQVLLATSPETASQRAIARAEQDQSRERDRYERDGGLQKRTYAAYERLAAENWAGDWLISAEQTDILKAITLKR